ncbi:transcriptional regulator WAR1, partial [Dichotomopilus funicola]
KKPRACESCRGLKVRCDPADPADPDGPCRRCLKGKRACVVTQPTRKRQKKTDSRVAELEKKIDALTAGLAARHGVGGGGGGGAGAGAGAGGGGGGAGGLGSGSGRSIVMGVGVGPGAGAGMAMGMGGGGTYDGGPSGWDREAEVVRYPPSPAAALSPHPRTLPPPSLPPLPPPSSLHQGPPSVARTPSGSTVAGTPALQGGIAGIKRKLDDRRDSTENASPAGIAARDPPSLSEPAREQQPDVVERGILTMGTAGELFLRYVNRMCPHLPGVVLAPGMTVAELRASQPTLFLSVMATAASELPALQRTLTKELMQVFADRIIVHGGKSLELVQALTVAVIWYWPPERFEELKFYQLVHIAAVMAIEIGLGRKKPAKSGFRKHISYAWRDHPLRKPPPPDPTTIEGRRTWLTCYFMTTNTAMALHRPNLLRWTPFMAECVEILQSSPEAAPTDKYLCHLVMSHKVAEDVSIHFSMDDPMSTPNLAEARTQYVLKGLERDLEKCCAAVPKLMQQPSLRMGFHVISLYMHEVATYSDTPDDGKLHPSETQLGTGGPLTSAHIDALTSCLAAIEGIFEVFLSLEVQTVRCLPVFNFVRVAYAVVVLIKLYFAAASPKGELGKVINPDDMKVEQHLDRMLEHFRATAAEDRSRPAAKFLVVLVMIRSWFHKQKQNQAPGAGPDATPAAGPSCAYMRPTAGERSNSAPLPHPRPPGQDYSTATASTPLEVLSELATNNSAAAATSGPRRPGTAGDLLHPLSHSPAPGSGSSWLNNTGSNNNNTKSQTMYNPTNNNTSPGPPASTSNSTAGAYVSNNITPGQQQLISNLSFPWLTNAFSSGAPDVDYDYSNFGNGFAQALDMTLGGFLDGGLGGEDTHGQQQQGWYPPMGAGLDAMGAAGSGGGFGF